MMLNRIVIFAKAPVPGQVKTRLIPMLGEEGAASLAHRMLLETYRQAASVPIARTELCLSPDPLDPVWEAYLPPLGAAGATSQGDGDLGHRLARAAERVIRDGEHVILVGTDCPQLTARRLKQACQGLTTHDAVIHPAADGGYALLGLSRFDASLFSGIKWSGPTVAKATLERLDRLAWSVHVGATLLDIDDPEDLELLQTCACEPSLRFRLPKPVAPRSPP
jgi:hypothetical protein